MQQLRRGTLLFAFLFTCLVLVGCTSPVNDPAKLHDQSQTEGPSARALQSIAIRVHRLDAMVAFYEEAFGATFREVDTFGISSRFAEIDGITIKFVPIRDSTEFEDFPSHQLGFEVDDLEAVVASAERHGGRREGEVRVDDGRRHGAIRDPDGNTIELYQSL